MAVAMSSAAPSPHIPHVVQQVLINTGALARCREVRAHTVFKPRRGGLLIETDAPQIPFFLFFGGAELDGGHGIDSAARFNRERAGRIRPAPPKNKKKP